MSYSIGFDIFARDRASEKFDKVGKSADQVGEKMARFKAAAVAGLAVAGAAVVQFAVEGISSASDLAETTNKAGVIFGKSADRIDKWSDTAAKSFGLSKNAALEAASGFGDMLSQLGYTQEEAAKASTNVVALAADLGSFNNLQTGEVLDMISASLRGEYDSLQRVIPNINAARVETMALSMTGKKAAKDLTAQEKATATLAIIQKDGARAAGDFAKTSDGLANSSKILTASLSDMQAKMGAKLLPVIASVTAAGIKMLDWIEENPGKVKAMTVGVAALTAALVVGKVAVLGHAFATGVAAAGGLGKFLLATRAGAAAQWLLNAAMSANPIGLVITALAALAVGLKYAWDNSETFRRVVTTAFGAVKAAALWLWESGIKPMVKFILAGFSWLTSGIASFLDALANVPGFGWAADAAKKMREAARAADDFAAGLDSLPNDVSININVRARWSDQAKKAAGLVNTNTQLAIDGFRASGGPVRKGGAYVVGEQGPELLVADEAGQVIDAGRTRQILSGGGPVPVSGGGGVVVNIFGALDPIGTARAVEDALVRLRRTNGGAPLAFMQ